MGTNMPFWMFAGIGLLFIILGIPMTLRMVKPNPIYGVRTPKCMRDERVWYEANAYCGKLIIVAGALTLITAIILHFTGISEFAYVMTCNGVMVVGVIIMAILTLIKVAKL